jgi:uncharacterized membrane protein YqiK
MKSETQTLILSGAGYDLVIAPEALEEKSLLLETSRKITSVSCADTSEAASAGLKALGTMRVAVEKSRNTVKAPVLAVGKKIDELAKEFQAEITHEENRLKGMQGEYAQKVLAERQRVQDELRRKAEAEAKAQDELRRQAAEAEAQRRKAEELEWGATSAEEQAQADAQAAAAQAAAADLQAKAAEAAKLAAAPTTFVPQAVKGVKMVADYEVTDIDALYRHNVGLVTLTERRKEILDAIARQTIGETLPSIPGLRVFMKAQVR